MNRIRVILPVAAALLFLSCSSVPSWVDTPPADSNDEIFFTGVGSDDSGDMAQAEQLAVNSLVNEITRYLGVRITSESRFQTVATSTTFDAELTDLIQEESYAYISDLRIVDTYSETAPNGALIVYLLGAYDRGALNAEKKRLEDLFIERIEVVTGPEREGDLSLNSGDLYTAARHYLESAAAALDSDIDNAEVIFERVIRKAGEAVSQIDLSRVTAPASASIGQPVTPVFSIAASGPAGGMAGVPFSVIWTKSASAGRGLSSTIVRTNPGGIASFSHPAPVAAGPGEVYFSLFFSPQLEPLKSAVGKADELVRGFERMVAEKSLEYRFSVFSDSMGYKTAIYFVDILTDGKVISDSQTASGISESITQAGFTVVPFPETDEFYRIDTTDFIDAVRLRGLTKAKRVIVGSASLTSVSMVDGIYLVTAEADLEVVDLDTGEILYSRSGSRSARGRGRETAVTTAFRELGKQIGTVLSRELP